MDVLAGVLSLGRSLEIKPGIEALDGRFGVDLRIADASNIVVGNVCVLSLCRG